MESRCLRDAVTITTAPFFGQLTVNAAFTRNFHYHYHYLYLCPKKHPVATVGFGGSRRAKKHPSLAATIPPHVCSANRILQDTYRARWITFVQPFQVGCSDDEVLPLHFDELLRNVTFQSQPNFRFFCARNLDCMPADEITEKPTRIRRPTCWNTLIL